MRILICLFILIGIVSFTGSAIAAGEICTIAKDIEVIIFLPKHQNMGNGTTPSEVTVEILVGQLDERNKDIITKWTFTDWSDATMVYDDENNVKFIAHRKDLKCE